MRMRESSEQEKEVMLSISKMDGGRPVSEKWFDKLCKSGERFFIVEEKKPIGFMALNHWFKYDKRGIELDIISILKKHQGKGIGTKLLKKAESIAKSLGRTFVYLLVSENNSQAISFYTKNGYVVCGQLCDRYGPGKHSLIMRKKLT